MKTNINSGQSLVELTFALGAIALVITGIASLATKSISNSSFSRNQSEATRLSQGASEWLRGEKSLGWKEFIQNVRGANSGLVCLDTLSWNKLRICSSNETVTGYPLFTRQVHFDCYVGNDSVANCSPSFVDNVRGVITTTWVDQRGMHESRIVTYLGDSK